MSKFKGRIKPHVASEKLSSFTAESPGPGAYDSHSSFSRQSKSTKKSSPTVKFGSADRDNYKKQYITAAQQKKVPSNYTGEISYLGGSSSSMGKMSSSTRKSAPKFGFGSSSRFGNSKSKRVTSDVDYASGSMSSMAKQAQSTKKSSPAFGFGTQERDRYNSQYLSKAHSQKQIIRTTEAVDFSDSTRSFGSQVKSTKKTSANFGFGTSSRAHASKTYMPKNF